MPDIFSAPMDRWVHGTMPQGEKAYNHKVVDADVGAMRIEHDSGMTYTEIAKRRGINRTTAARIIKGEAWKHIERAS
jgi:hypothetical protein